MRLGHAESKTTDASAQPAVDLYWLPLGAGGHFVRLNGRLYEALAAWLGRRPACNLYHSALEVRLPEGRYVIESAPIRPTDGPDRGVVAEGLSAHAGRGVSGSSATSCVSGGTASSRTSAKPWTVPGT